VFVTRIGEQKEGQSKEHSYQDPDGAGVVIRADRVQESPARKWSVRTKPGYQVEEERQEKSKNAYDSTMSLLREISGFIRSHLQLDSDAGR
jgi:hypothetical protein